MGKDKKKDKKKQGKGAEKTAAKTAKNAAKKNAKMRKKEGNDEEDIEVSAGDIAPSPLPGRTSNGSFSPRNGSWIRIWGEGS